MTVETLSKRDIASELRAEMGRQKISARELARQLNVSPSYMARRVSGETPISADELRAAAFVLRVPIASLYGERLS